MCEQNNESLPAKILEAAKSAKSFLTKSEQKYRERYKQFKTWRENNKINHTDEQVLLAYFLEHSEKCAPSTLLTYYTILKNTLLLYENVKLDNYTRLQRFLNHKTANYRPKRCKSFTHEELEKFLVEAPDDKYLLTKAIAIYGIYSAASGVELKNVKIQHIHEQCGSILIDIPITKTYHKPRRYIVDKLYSPLLRKYMALRPKRVVTDRFFLNYHNGKCTTQPISGSRFSQFPKHIARYLKLDNPELYTGHVYRQSSATMLINSETNMLTLRRLSVWESSTVTKR